MRVLDFFSGCGGASEGFRQAGFDIALGLDNDSDAAATYRKNFPSAFFIQKDIREVSDEEVSKLLGKGERGPLLLTACAPCQPFSLQNKFKGSSDERFALLDETHRFIEALKPEYVVIENVPGMQNIKESDDGPFGRLLKLLEKSNYSYTFSVAHAQNYGIPQKRKRLILIASKLAEISLPAETHGEGMAPYRTVRDVIGGLPALQHGDADELDPIHITARMSDINIERIQHTPEGGDRRNWPDYLINPGHRNYKGHTDTYGRMSWDSPAPTLTTKCHSYSNGRFGHPDVSQNRAISIREASRIQTFPSEYKFQGAMGSMARQIGNAVPCELAKVFGEHIKKHYYSFSKN